MADKFADRLAGYVEVKDRIAVLLEYFPQARITTTYDLTTEPDDKPKVICRALVYREPDDPVPVTGTSWMYLPGTTSFTKGSEIENAETSAVGRAIGLMGILIDKSIATTNEIDSKQDEGRAKREPRNVSRDEAVAAAASDEPTLIGPYSATGEIVVRKTGSSDGNLRQGSDGGYFIVAFKTTDGESVPQLLVKDPLAVDLLDAAGADLNGLICTIEGDEYSVPFRNGDFSRPFKRVHLARIRTASWTLPTLVQSGPGLFDAEAEAELDAIVLP